ncbi:cytochrome c, mono- and diheme variants family [Terriglobus roseus DSM 18391]|uniref:Cytochrome c, mono-and diheme variants family n=1 Tax=Terriglobus roseus (strain DSM 18391 / NRRL B-41598 / KBS 63) TaxID=926566 RepID=I3ZBL8_TERRK|nr:c-type cytochrome [Terriglobus roseus]AFL86636.1 cytochrome c, mono- and diheme variants family [Terriglobus roseus DSM 18391]
MQALGIKKQARLSQPEVQATGNRAKGTGFQRIAAATIACASMLGLAGCRQDMHNQPKFYPQRGTSFYADGRSARPQVLGTIARGQEDSGSYFRTGMVNGAEGDGLPVPLNADLIARGQERYNIYCTSCHSRTGNGRGMIVMRGFMAAGNFHTERLRSAPLGHFYNVITNGYGAMPDYSGQIEPADRWAIAAYVRALQLSQHATTADAGGAKVEKMEDVEAKEGFAPDFLKDWELPATSGQIKSSAPAAAPLPAPMPAPAAEAAKPAQVSQANPKTAPLASALPAGAKPTVATVAVAKTEARASAPSAVAPHAAAGDVANGQKLYMANCSVCHQPNRAGMAPMIPSLVGIVARVGAAHIHAQVANGAQTGPVKMPAFPRLSTANVDDIIAFLAASK